MKEWTKKVTFWTKKLHVPFNMVQTTFDWENLLTLLFLDIAEHNKHYTHYILSTHYVLHLNGITNATIHHIEIECCHQPLEDQHLVWKQHPSATAVFIDPLLLNSNKWPQYDWHKSSLMSLELISWSKQTVVLPTSLWGSISGEFGLWLFKALLGSRWTPENFLHLLTAIDVT